MPQLNPLFCFQLLQTSLKALGRLMVVLLRDRDHQWLLPEHSPCEYMWGKGESMVPVDSRDRDLGTERTMRGAEISC